MGGIDSEVGISTKNILLESAYFNPALIRRASKLSGITSESSYRFERNVDKEMLLWSSDRAVNLILDLAGGVLVKSVVAKASSKKETAKK
jgi:phenylalanyl-tRNA synthetase beta subunit (EC 6.1.1.20)